MRGSLCIGIILIVGATGCRATFDSDGNLTASALKGHAASAQQLTNSDAAFIHERSCQLWQPENPSEGVTTTLVSQAALVSKDGYALTAAHAVDGKGAFTAHRVEAPHNLVRVKRLDESGLHHFELNGPEEIVKQAKLEPVRVVKRFDDTDLALIQIAATTSVFFELAAHPPTAGSRIRYAFNPIIHPQLRGLEGTVTKPTHSEDTWRLECQGAAIFGDSGGAAINESGYLVGNITGSRFNLFSNKMKPRILGIEIEGIAALTVKTAIQQDRLSQKKSS